MANTTKYQKTPKSKAELIAEARIRQQHKKEAEAAQTPEQKQGIPILSDIWNFIGNIPVIGKWYATIADFSTEAFQGAVSTVEGIVDMAASVVGKFGDENFKKKVQDFIKTDFTGTYITPLVKDTIPTEQSLITALPEQPERIVRGVGQGIGQMAPALLTGGIGSAAGLGAGAVQAIGTGTFMAGAGGRGVQEAYQEGASYDEGLAYGILSGALEGAIERLTGGVGTKVFGKGLINKVVGKAAKSGLFKLAMNAAGEGFEEALSEVLNPYLKRLTYDKDAPTATKEEILESAIIGALTSIALGSTAQDVDIKAIQDAQQEISRAWAENRMPDLKQAAQELQKLDAKTRKAILETTNLSRHIDENGNIKQVQQSEAYSPNLDESKLAYKPTTQALTAEQQEAKKLFVKLTKGTRGLVFAEMPEGINGAYKDGVIYVNTKANAAQEIIKHELAHSIEGTKAYNKFAKHVLQTLIDNPELAKNIKGETLEQSITKTSELYQKVLEGKDLTEQQREILTEIVAQYSEKLLTDKTQIEGLVNQDKSIAQRILDWIRDKLAVLKGKTKAEKDTIAFLRKAERLYVEALGETAQAKETKYSISDKEKTEEHRQKAIEEFGYTPYFYDAGYILPDGKMLNLSGEKGKHFGFRGEDHRIIQSIFEEGELKGKHQSEGMIQFMNEGNLRIIPEVPGIDISLEAEPTIDQYTTIQKFISDYGFRERYFSVDFSSKNGDIVASIEYDGNVRASKVINDIKAYFKTGKIPQQSEIDKFRYSLSDTDSEGRKLTKEQQEFFKNSNVRDDDGKLLVVYHGTKNEFTVFDPARALDVGMHFGTKEAAKRFGDIKAYYLNARVNEKPIRDVFSNTKYTPHDVINLLADDGIISYDDYLLIRDKYSDNRLFDMNYDDLEGYVWEYYRDHLEEYYEEKEIEVLEGEDYDPDYIDIDRILEYTDVGEKTLEAWQNLTRSIWKDLVPIIKENGYTGLKYINDVEDAGSVSYVVFDPNQIKLVSNQSPTQSEDIRYSLDDTIHLKPTKLDKLQQKRYTKKEAETIVKNILNEISLENYTAKLKGETKKEAVKVLWNALNTKTVGNRAKAALDIAEYILNNAVAVDITANDAVFEAASVQNTLRRYLRSLDLTNLQGEIKARYGSVKRMNLLWGKKGGIAVDALPRILAEEGIHIEAKTPADILFEVDRLYANSQKQIRDAADKRLAEVFGQKELKGIKSQIARDILRSYDEYGTETAFTKQLNKYAEKISTLKEQLKETRALYEAENKLKNTIDRVAGLEKFKGANQELTELVGGLVKSLSKIKTPWGNISKNVREAMRGYKKFYAELADVSESDLQTDFVYKMISDIAEGEGRLTLDEMRNLNDVLKNFISNARAYQKLFFEGKRQDAREVATRAIKELRQTKKVATTGIKGLWNKLRHWMESPAARFERLGMYGLAGDTVMKSLWDLFVEAEQMQAAFLRDTYLMFYDFFEQNKNYLKKLYKSKVGFAGDKISKGQAMYLYLLSLREQIIAHIYNLQMGEKPSDSDKGIIRVLNDKYDDPYKAYLRGRDITYTRADIRGLEKHFDATDKEFIKLARKFFNEHAKEAKRRTDLKIYGVSNVSETGDYISAHTSKDTLYTKIGERDLFTELFNVYNPGFNKDVKPNAKNKLVVGNIYDVINRHAQQMALYAGYGAPVRTFNRIINTEVGDTTVKQMLMEVDPDFLNYVNKLLKDAQGIRQQREGFDKFLGKIRGMGARAELGLKPKVVITQYVSLFASKGVGIEYKNILKGAKKAVKATKADYDLMYKYVPMAWVRANSGFNAEIGFIKEGQGVIGKANKWLDKTTALIEKVDSWVVFATWNAALEQTKSQYTPFSEEHYKAAAKLTHEAVVKTQANYIPLYRPEILRSQSSFLQLATMFMSEPLQQFSQAVEAIDKILMANYIIKNSKDDNIIANAEQIKKQAFTQARNAFTMLTVDNILLVAITQAFKYLLGTQDEEDPLGDIGNDFLGVVTGMFPFVRDIHSYLEGYDITNMYQTGLTTIANAFKDAASLLGGDTENTTRNMRRTLIGVSQIFGIPLRNLETYAKGIIGLFSPSAKYKYEDLFYRQSYAKDLSRAVEKGDDKLADTIIDLMLNDKGIGKTDEKARAEILKLYAAGESVLPSGVPKTVIINGEERKLTEAERRQITSIYSQADMTKLVNMPEYSKLTSTQKARAIKIVYDIYKDKAFSSVLGLDISKRALFAYAIDASIIAYVLAVAGDMAGDKKLKMQQLINKLDISAAQKYMLMGLLGYKNKNGAGQVKAYINRLDLSREEKKRLYEYSGY